VFPLASLGTTLLMARFLHLAARETTGGEATDPRAWWFLLSAALLLPWFWPLPLERVSPLWSALWPVLLGAMLAGLAYRGRLAKRISSWAVLPPGDLLVLLEGLLRRWYRPPHHHAHHARELPALLQPPPVPGVIAAPERRLARWPLAISLLLGLCLGVFLLTARLPGG
jgi:hypothetical protein